VPPADLVRGPDALVGLGRRHADVHDRDVGPVLPDRREQLVRVGGLGDDVDPLTAHEIRRRHPEMGIVLLSQHVEVGVATQVLAAAPQHLGYLLKDRVTDPADFAGSLRRVAAGGTALDPQVVSGLLADPEESSPLRTLSPRERSVLELLAEGHSNKGIGERLSITQGAVQKHVSAIFEKLGLPAGDESDRRILAVLAYLAP
jgi:DNA-binding NarL/FixJ family response regulator